MAAFGEEWVEANSGALPTNEKSGHASEEQIPQGFRGRVKTDFADSDARGATKNLDHLRRAQARAAESG